MKVRFAKPLSLVAFLGLAAFLCCHSAMAGCANAESKFYSIAAGKVTATQACEIQVCANVNGHATTWSLRDGRKLSTRIGTAYEPAGSYINNTLAKSFVRVLPGTSKKIRCYQIQGAAALNCGAIPDQPL